MYSILKASGPLVASSLRSERYSPGPFGLLNPVHSMASESNYIVHSSRTLQSSLLLPSPLSALMRPLHVGIRLCSEYVPQRSALMGHHSRAPQCIVFSSSQVANRNFSLASTVTIIFSDKETTVCTGG